MTDDREVWKKISRGDVAAFDAFYRENAPRLQAFLRQVVGNHQAAEDVAQETFTQIWDRPSGFQPERGTLRGYLFGIAKNKASEWWRKQPSGAPMAEEEKSLCRTETTSIMGMRSIDFQRNNKRCCGCAKSKGCPTRNWHCIWKLPWAR